MANHKSRVPKKGDRVTTPKLKGVFFVVDVKENPRLADIRLLNGSLMLRNIPWWILTFLDEGPQA
jgi:hypothetical protein